MTTWYLPLRLYQLHETYSTFSPVRWALAAGGCKSWGGSWLCENWTELIFFSKATQQASFVSSGTLQRLHCSLWCKNIQTSFPAFVCGRLNYCNSLFTGVPLGINGARPAHTNQFADLCTLFYRGLAALVTYDLNHQCLSSTVYFYGTSWSAPVLLCWLSFSHCCRL